jgi:hypothetical protein
VGELDGELGLADAAEAGGGRDLPHDRGPPALEGLGQAPQIGLAADEVGIAGEGQPRAGREGGRGGHLLERQARQALERGGEGGIIHRLGHRRGVVVAGDVDLRVHLLTLLVEVDAPVDRGLISDHADLAIFNVNPS